MDCVLKEAINLGGCRYCAARQCRCDGTMRNEWHEDYVLIDENKVCVSQGKYNRFIEVTKDDLIQISIGEKDLMIRTEGGGVVFIRAKAET